jgi:hypothetical protein
MTDPQVQKYAYLVEHPAHGTKIFYNPYDSDLSARLAVDYAENTVIVFKLPLHESELSVQDLSAQFSVIAKPNVELPNIPVEALLSSVG